MFSSCLMRNKLLLVEMKIKPLVLSEQFFWGCVLLIFSKGSESTAAAEEPRFSITSCLLEPRCPVVSLWADGTALAPRVRRIGNVSTPLFWDLRPPRRHPVVMTTEITLSQKREEEWRRSRTAIGSGIS